MAIYHFQNKIVSRGSGQSVTAKSAYNSASKIRDFQENSIKDYSNKMCDYSNIILPKNAPDVYKDREFLWNKVNDVEKRKDSQLAREIIIGLPNEFDRDDNIELAEEFAKTLADEGMIVDLNIHKIDSENPHAHLLCTLRGLKENGEFEPKRNGNKFIRDWNTDEKHNEWRKRWEVIQNKHLESKGFLSRVSCESYSNQNINLIPTKKEGWKARKFEDETGKKSKIANYNDKIRSKNKDIINSNYKEIYNKQTEKNNAFKYLNNEDSKKIKSLAKDLKLFVTPTNIFKEEQKIYDLKEKLSLISDENIKNEKLDKFNDRSEKLQHLKHIFEKQADIYFRETHPAIEKDYTIDEKVFVTYHILNSNNPVTNKKDIDDILAPKVKIESQIALNTLLGNREISLKSLEKETNFFVEKLDVLLKENDLTFENALNNEISDSNIQEKANYYINKLDRLKTGEDILNTYYDSQIRELFNNDDDYKAFVDTTSLEEKQAFIDFKKYHGDENTIKMIEENKFIPRFTKIQRNELSTLLVSLQEKQFKSNKSQFDHYAITQLTKKCLDEYNFDPSDNNDIKHLEQEAFQENDKETLKNIETFYDGEQIFKENSYNYSSNKFLASSLADAMIFNFGEIFRERMPKYQNKQYKSKNYSKNRHELNNKRGIHL